MDKKLNPLDGEIDLLGDNVSDIIRKLNPLTGRLELVYGADSYIQKINPYIGDFDLVSGEAPSYIIKTLTGNGYIDLTNAIANQLLHLKLFGGIRQGLPEGYILLDGITGDGNAYIDLNMQLTEDDEADVYFTKPSQLASSNVFGGRTSATSNNISVIIASSGNAVLDFNNSDYTDYRINTSISLNTQYKAVLSKSGRYIYQGDTLIDSNTTACGDTIETPGTYLFHLAGSGLTSKFAGTINRCVIKGKKDLIPCKDSNNVVGMYDIINGVFYTNANETGSFTAGNTTSTAPTPTAPQDITCNNGVLKYGNTGNNLYDPNDVLITLGRYINASNGAVLESSTNFMIEKYFEVEPGEKYVYYGRNRDTNRISSYNRIAFYDENKNFLITGSYTKDRIGTGTAPANAKYARLSNNPSGESAQGGTPVDLEYIHGYNRTFKKGTAETDFDGYSVQTYVEGIVETVEDELSNTATAENLFAIGDTKDVQEVLSGHITRNIGIKILDGTENWQFATQLLNYMYSLQVDDMFAESLSVTSNRQSPYSTHFERSTNRISGQAARQNKIQAYTGSKSNTYLGLGYGTPSSANLNDFKQRLADQYIAGTPVIIVYPLKTPTTETVTGQTLNIQTGSNRIEITQASIDNLPLEVKYKATS